jgi:hypothetical protein
MPFPCVNVEYSCNINIPVNYFVFSFYLRSERLAKEALLTDQSHVDEEKQRLDWCANENEKFNRTSAQMRYILRLT